MGSILQRQSQRRHAVHLSIASETFPFPPDWETNAKLEEIGQRYYEFRAALMVKNDQGLTATYNRFHDPDEHDPEIVELRALHDEMDRAVLDAYAWTDIVPVCQFLLDYEEEEEDPTPTRRAKKKPWRYRWPDETRDEILARLLALNATRAAEELRTALPPPSRRTPPNRKPKRGGPQRKPRLRPDALLITLQRSDKPLGVRIIPVRPPVGLAHKRAHPPTDRCVGSPPRGHRCSPLQSTPAAFARRKASDLRTAI
ncbi:MAG: hypothetical protein IPK07_34515 [Deltaproteobacteria bacterium]|nr:hypothetical protein [Deltaproteobacteria bacterium]